MKSRLVASSGQSDVRSLRAPFCSTTGHSMLKMHEVHLWRATLDRPRSEVQHLEMMLSADEHARVARFRATKDRDRFIVARGLLRVMLGHYLDRGPAQLRFRYGLHGKPTLASESGSNIIRFSLSHSDGMGLYAFARGREVGVDVERLRPHPMDERVAEHYFSPRENEILRDLSSSEWQRAFLRSWTRREAYLKARGESLSFLTRLSDLSLVPSEPVGLASTGEDSRQAPRWFLTELDLGSGYVGAVVVEGRGCQLICGQCCGFVRHGLEQVRLSYRPRLAL